MVGVARAPAALAAQRRKMQALREGFVIAESSLDAIVKSMEAAGAAQSKKTKELDAETERFEAEKAAAALELDRLERELRNM